MISKHLFLSSLLTLSLPVFSATTSKTELNFACTNKNASSYEKTLNLALTISTLNNGKKYFYASVETKRDIFELGRVKNNPNLFDTDSFTVDAGGTELEASCQLKLSEAISENLNSFDASWIFLVSEQVISLGEGNLNPEEFSCSVAKPVVSSVSPALKASAEEYIKSLGDEWNVVGKTMTAYDFSKGILGKEKRKIERTGSDTGIDGHRVTLKVDGAPVQVFVVVVTEEESGSLTVYTDKGMPITSTEYSN